jgi:HlyD family secretion protein
MVILRSALMRRRVFVIGLLILALALAACGGEEEPEATPQVVEAFVPVVSVTGEVVPARWARVAPRAGGQVTEVLVEPGDEVEDDALMVQLDDADAQLAVRQAEAALARAQAGLEQMRAEARPEEVAAAEAGIAAAAAGLQKVYEGAGDQQIAAALAELKNAEAALKQARSAYDAVSWRPEISMLPQSLELERATNAYDAAKARYEDLVEGPSYADVGQARAQVDQAKAQLELLQAGASEEAVAVAEAEVRAAEVALEQAETALEHTEVRAPFAGTVGWTDARVGEFVSPGQPLLTLGDLSSLRVETTDLDEIDVARVEGGQPATVTFDAFPDEPLAGRVSRISPMAEPEGGGVTYTVVVELEETHPGVRWGMTAFVDIETGE